MDNIKAVLFDLDNTILDRTRTFENFTKELIGTYFEHLETTQAILDRIIYLDQDGYKNKNVLFEELLEQLPWKAKPQKQELLAFYDSRYVRNAVLMDQAREVLAYVRTKYKTGLITNGRTAIQYGKIDRLGIRNAFDSIVVSEEAGIKKPDPRIFHMAIEKLQVLPEACLYIGDHPLNDIEGAEGAGMKTIWIKVNQPWKDELKARPLYTVEQLSELLVIL